MAARRAIFRDSGLDVIDPDSIPGDCHSPWLADSGSDCPEEEFALVRFGPSSREGGAYLSGGIDEREEGIRAGHRAIRMMYDVYAPEGVQGTLYDVIVEKRDGSWRALKMVGLLAID